MEILRCDCGRGFDLDAGRGEVTAECPDCGTRWKVEPKRGYFRISRWVD